MRATWRHHRHSARSGKAQLGGAFAIAGPKHDRLFFNKRFRNDPFLARRLLLNGDVHPPVGQPVGDALANAPSLPEAEFANPSRTNEGARMKVPDTMSSFASL